jgi:hypothetical protein
MINLNQRTSMNQELTSPAASVSTDQAANAAHFAIALRNFNGLLRTNSFAQALIWARQTEQLAAVTNEPTMTAAVREAYVALILTGAAKFEALTLHCGNITSTQGTLADIIAESTDCLVEHLRGGKEIPYAVALAVQGFSKILQGRVAAHVESAELLTSAEFLAEVFQSLDPIVEHTSSLSRSPELFELSLDEKLAFAATAMSNAGYELNWLLPSDWDKASFYCKRVQLLLTEKALTLAGQDLQTAPPKAIHPRLQGVVDALPAVLISLTDRQYRQSKRRLKAITTALQAIVT